jgi:3-isopropylmalate/(R)-2-methylmalate dehydratase small subunit
MKLEGNAIKYGDNIDTDVIIPARYLNSSDPEELAAHCMEDLDKTFVSRVKPGDIMVAGSNFGCGSSREHAPLVIKTSGIGAVIAKSFARIFFRNAINIGLPINFDRGEIRNLTKNTSVDFAPFPPFLQDIIAKGGLMNSVKGAG